MNFKIIFLVFLSASVAAASSGGEGGSIHSTGVPSVVFYQLINVLILFGGIYWKLRHQVVSFFNEKRKKYLEEQEKAQKALIAAEHEHHEVKTRLDKLKNNRLDTISKAKADANDLHRQILADAGAMAKKLENEAELAAKIELQRAKNELRETLLKEAFELSHRDIAVKTTTDDQKRLQREFISKVEVAQ
jgi:F-type H+-transporting ATPase subunit b